jgi:glycerol-3-phosphate acyltransferase PlsX
MGGDHAPVEVITGAAAAARELGLFVTLVGPAGQLAGELARLPGGAPSSVSILDAPDFITMGEGPLQALRRKPRASIVVAAEAVARGDADALFSAGHTGATLLAAHAAFGLLPGADRPALAVLVPTLTGTAVMLDTGATLDCRPDHLRAFAVMGSAYAQAALGVERPRVGLLTVGEEAGKGTELIREARGLLESAPIHFVGNVEARDFFVGGADVIVCDGFTGNVILKVGEGLIEALVRLLRQELGPSLSKRIAGWLVKDAWNRLRARVDATEHGGAPLLGVNGTVLVSHGRSKAHAVRNGIATAARLAETHMVSRLRDALVQMRA